MQTVPMCDSAPRWFPADHADEAGVFGLPGGVTGVWEWHPADLFDGDPAGCGWRLYRATDWPDNYRGGKRWAGAATTSTTDLIYTAERLLDTRVHALQPMTYDIGLLLEGWFRCPLFAVLSEDPDCWENPAGLMVDHPTRLAYRVSMMSEALETSAVREVTS